MLTVCREWTWSEAKLCELKMANLGSQSWQHLIDALSGKEVEISELLFKFALLSRIIKIENLNAQNLKCNV